MGIFLESVQRDLGGVIIGEPVAYEYMAFTWRFVNEEIESKKNNIGELNELAEKGWKVIDRIPIPIEDSIKSYTRITLLLERKYKIEFKIK